MATPVSSAYAFHHRFDAVPVKDTPPSGKDASSTARLSSENFEYPDLDAGQFYSSAATHSAPAPAPASASAPALTKLPDFPEFKSFDSNDLFQSNNLFQQYAPHSAASAALVEPQSAQIEGSPSSEQLESSTAAAVQVESPAQQPAAPDAPESHVSPDADGPAMNGQQQQQQEQQEQEQEQQVQQHQQQEHQQQQQQQPQQQQQFPEQGSQEQQHHEQQAPHERVEERAVALEQSQLERHFSSASSYVQPPHIQGNSHESQAPSHASHAIQRNPLPRPPSLPVSPQPQLNGTAYSQSVQERSAPAQNGAQPGSAFAFPAQNAPAGPPATTQAAAQQAPLPTLPQQPATRPARDALPMAGLRINEAEHASEQQPSPRPSGNRDENGDRTRPSSFFGMQRPAAALDAAGQHVPVPPSMLADDDGFYQDQQHLQHPNGTGQPQQRNQEDLHQGIRPSSFFGVEGDSAPNMAPHAVTTPNPVSERSAPGTRGSSFQRAESAPRGISTAAGGTGNGPMPGSGGFGGLGPAGANRPASIAPSVASGPLLDHSHLKVGQKASLLSHGKTLELYRQNAKKTNDPNLIYELAVFMIDAAKTMGTDDDGAAPVTAVNGPNKIDTQKEELIKEATGLLKKIADRGHPDAQYFLADCYANGIGTRTGKQDFGQAYTYFVLAAKHGHPDAAYRAGTCYEKGWGCRKDTGKALQFYRKAAAQSHPGAMYRLATAELNGELGLKKNAKEGVKWLKRSAEAATPEFPHALHELALLHERGIDNVLFVDPEYSCELLAQAGEMGYAPSAYKLGVNYEYGRMGCPQDGGLSIHMYNIAAQQNHKEACFALTAWYLVGAPGILPQSDTEAYLWAKKAAEQGLAKAEYAVGYFTEMGIGTVKDLNEAKAWYKRAADHGDKRANQRIAILQGRGGPTDLAGIGARGQTVQPSTSVTRQQQKQEQRESMNEFGRRAQPTSAPFPASITQSSMTPSTQINYPSPLAMREAQTAQREQQYMANVAAHERAQARAMLRHSPSQQEVGSPVSAGPSPTTGLPRPPPMPQQHQQPLQPQRQGSHSSQPPVPFSQPQAYPSYPMSASAAPPQPRANGSIQSPQGPPMTNPMFPPAPGSQYASRPNPGPGSGTGNSGNGHSPMTQHTGSTPPARADLDKEDDKKKKKGWFGRS